MELAIGLFLSVLDVSILFYFVKRCLNTKVDNKLFTLVLVIIQVLVNTQINKIFGYGSPIGFIVMAASAVVVTTIMFKSNVMLSFILVFSGLTLILISDSVTVSILGLILGEGLANFFSNPITLISGALLAKAIFYFIAVMGLSKVINRKKLLEQVDLGRSSNKYVIGIILLFNTLLIYALIFVQRHSELFDGNPMDFLKYWLMFIVAFTVLIAYILTKNIKLVSKEIEWEYKEEILREQRVYVENINEVMTAIRSQNHDFNHHIGCIYGLIEEKSYVESQAYIGKLVNESIEYDSFVHSKNKIINTIINVSVQKAIRDKIKVDSKVDIGQNVKFDFIDYSIVIGNIMNNAIEACKHVEGKKYISVNIYEKNENIIIKVNNTKSSLVKMVKNDDGTFKTSKKENIENHGFGLKNIKRIVEKYEGTSNFIANDESFEVQVAIPIA